MKFPASLSFLAVPFPNIQPQDTRENPLTVSGTLLGKLIGFALQKERSVDKSFIIQVERLADEIIGGAHGCFGEGQPCALRVANAELQCG